MLKSRKDDEVVARLKKELDAFKAYLPLLQVGVGGDLGFRAGCAAEERAFTCSHRTSHGV